MPRKPDSSIAQCSRILVYKRTHEGDPDPASGRFGIYDCMGQVRDFGFDAVIGVGGTGQKAERSGVAGLVNWIGVGPTKRQQKCRWDYTTTIVRFEKFRYLVEDGIDFRRAAPNFAKRIYDGRVRYLIIDERYPRELRESNELLELADLSEVRNVKAKSKLKRTCSPSARKCQ